MVVDKPLSRSQECFNVGLSHTSMSTWLEGCSWLNLKEQNGVNRFTIRPRPKVTVGLHSL